MKELEIFKIYKEDCIKNMNKMPDSFIDLTVTSPPYDNLRTYEKYEFEFKTVAEEKSKETITEKKLTSENWLEVFDKTDLTGPSRAFFSNLQIQKVEGDTIYFEGAEMFADRINKENIQNLIDSLKRLNFPEYKVEIKSIEKAKNTPSSKWEQQRKKDIEKFKKEIINSDLLANLKNNFGEDIDEDKIMVIDHEE